MGFEGGKCPVLAEGVGVWKAVCKAKWELGERLDLDVNIPSLQLIFIGSPYFTTIVHRVKHLTISLNPHQ